MALLRRWSGRVKRVSTSMEMSGEDPGVPVRKECVLIRRVSFELISFKERSIWVRILSSGPFPT